MKTNSQIVENVMIKFRERSEKIKPFSECLVEQIHFFFLVFLPPILLLGFLISAFPDDAKPRLLILLRPFFDPEFIDTVWLGKNLPDAPITGERVLATALGFFAVFSAFCCGRLFFTPVRKIINFNKRETIFFSTTLGLIVFSTLLLYSGLLGFANIRFLACVLCVFSIFFFTIWTIKTRSPFKKISFSPKRDKRRFSFAFFCPFILLILFAFLCVVGASTPLFEYDSAEYHAQSAREIFENGKIAFFAHNAYANMPLGADMFYLFGFNFVRDLGFEGANVLRLGSLVGKTILASFTLLTAFGIWIFGKRFFTREDAGLWGAVLYLSFPSVFYNYSNGLNDAVLATAIFAALYLFLLGVTKRKRFFHERSALFLWTTTLGVFAGFACAVKYTSVVFVWIPLFLELCAIIWAPRYALFFPRVKKQDVEEPSSNKSPALALVVFIASSCVVCGGWYFRNVVATGNPVYPLAYSVFGDKTEQWSESINQLWRLEHSSSDYSLKALGDACLTALCNDLFSSPFFLWFASFGIAFFLDIALVAKQTAKSPSRKIRIARERKTLSVLFILVAIFWVVWFLTTHRLLRFLVPIMPLVATILGLFAAKGATKRSRLSQGALICSLLVGLLYSGLLFDRFGKGRLAPLRALEQDPFRFPQAAIFFNDRPELFDGSYDSNERQKLLLIGEVRAFRYRIPVLYSTIWNDSPLISYIEGGVERDAKGEIIRVSNVAQIVANFKEARVAYVLVDFSELERIRKSNERGWNNDEINENLFNLLVESNALVPFKPKELENVDDDEVRVYQVCSQSR